MTRQGRATFSRRVRRSALDAAAICARARLWNSTRRTGGSRPTQFRLLIRIALSSFGQGRKTVVYRLSSGRPDGFRPHPWNGSAEPLVPSGISHAAGHVIVYPADAVQDLDRKTGRLVRECRYEDQTPQNQDNSNNFQGLHAIDYRPGADEPQVFPRFSATSRDLRDLPRAAFRSVRPFLFRTSGT